MTKEYIKCANCGSEKFKTLTKFRVYKTARYINKYSTVVVCSECGLVFLNPRNIQEEYDLFYKESYKNISQNLSLAQIVDNDKRYDEKKKIVSFLLSNIKKQESIKLIDIGCGLGIMLDILRDNGIVGEGLEPGENAIEFTRKNGFVVHDGSIDSHNVKEKYNVVTSTALIEHVMDPVSSFKQMSSLLLSDGYLLIQTPDYFGMNLRRKGVRSFFKFVHTYYYTENMLRSLLGQAGLKVVKVYKIKKSYNRSGTLCVLAQKTSDKSVYLKDDIKKIFWYFKITKYKYNIIIFFDRVIKKIKKYCLLCFLKK